MIVPTLTTLTAHTTARAADVMADLNALLAVLDPDSGADGGVDGNNMKRGSAGQLWVADGSTGAFIRRTVSTATSDLGVDGNGVFTIGDKKVTSRKLSPAAGSLQQSGGTKTLTTAFSDVAGTTYNVTPAVTSVLMVTMTFKFSILSAITHNLSADATGQLLLDGAPVGDPAILGGDVAKNPTTNMARVDGTVSRGMAVSLSAAAHTLKLQAKVSSVTDQGGLLDNAAFTYLLLGI